MKNIMGNYKSSEIIKLRSEIEQLEKKMLLSFNNIRVYNKFKNEQWQLINKLKKLEDLPDVVN